MWKPYVSVAARRRRVERELARARKKGTAFSPVVLAGHAISKTFWGKSWCENLERYSDFSNRLPRGRSYVRNGAVLDLQIAAGEVAARVVGTSLYRVKINVSVVPRARWGALRRYCAGGIDSLVELLQGRFSKGVMERICRQGDGLFPSPREITFDCSCPDRASMCKHVAATLYGIGARLDAKPELLFLLRKVNEKDLIATAGKALPLAAKTPAAGKVLDDARLGEIFGIEMAAGARSRETATRKSAKKDNASSGASKRAIPLPDPKTKVHRRAGRKLRWRS
ncbi:MAG: hypothetical protein ACRET7_04125 [Burkholderiales bacterium]